MPCWSWTPHLGADLRWPSAGGLGVESQKKAVFKSAPTMSASALLLSCSCKTVNAPFLPLHVCVSMWGNRAFSCRNTRWFLPENERWKYQTTQTSKRPLHRWPFLCGLQSLTASISLCVEQADIKTHQIPHGSSQTAFEAAMNKN